MVVVVVVLAAAAAVVVVVVVVVVVFGWQLKSSAVRDDNDGLMVIQSGDRPEGSDNNNRTEVMMM